jgi:crotonobetainyl-CoA:carnitine CoA-transferase CaiB-like acyl-CoA transferase
MSEVIRPLEGVRVVELAAWVAAPSAGAVLADMGADVIKVEPPGGDPFRRRMRPAKFDDDQVDPDFPFQAENRGKRSICIAIDQPAGADIVKRLVADADVLLTNLLPHRQGRYGLTPDQLWAVNPRLVYAAVSGYGQTGPDADRPGYDWTAFIGRGGLVGAMTPADGEALLTPQAQGDHTTGLAAVAGILAGLRTVEQTGTGMVVDVSLFATAVWTLSSAFATTLADGHQPRVRDRHHELSPIANRYRCQDGRWIILSMPEDRWWAPFCEAIGKPEWVEDRRYATPRDRYRAMPELVDELDEIFAGRRLGEWAEIFDQAGLIWGPGSLFVDIAVDSQAEAIGLFPEVDHPEAGTFRTVATPVHMEGVAPRGHGPEPGEHTDEILAELGIEPSTVASLRASGAVGRRAGKGSGRT